jgi:hypothetical protein
VDGRAATVGLHRDSEYVRRDDLFVAERGAPLRDSDIEHVI